MVLELVHVDLQRSFVAAQSTEEHRARFVHVFGRESAEDTICAVRRRRFEQVEEFLVDLFVARCGSGLVRSRRDGLEGVRRERGNVQDSAVACRDCRYRSMSFS
jgi:hypothetical protein